MSEWKQLDWNHMTHDERMEWLRQSVEQLQEEVKAIAKLRGDMRFVLGLMERVTERHLKSMRDDDARTET